MGDRKLGHADLSSEEFVLNDQVLSTLDQAGSTTTYAAVGPDGEKVSMKALSLQSMANWDELEAFERESRALRTISTNSAAIPRFVEVFEEDDQDRTFYLIQVGGHFLMMSTMPMTVLHFDQVFGRDLLLLVARAVSDGRQ